MSIKLKSFEIKKLFYSKNVKINFDSKTKILIGENGVGKTTILYIIYHSLIGDFNKLRKIDFEKIIISFDNEEKVVIKKDDILLLNERHGRYLYENERRFSNRIGRSSQYYSEKQEIIQHMERIFRNNEKEELSLLFEKHNYPKARHICYEFARKIYEVTSERYPSDYVYEALKDYYGSNNYELIKKKNIIKDNLEEEIVYFPTYRRIEEDVNNLGIESRSASLSDSLIQFGMEDVNKIIESVLELVRKSSVDGFSKITGEILTEYVNDVSIENPSTLKKKFTPEVIEIILSRVGDNIKDTDKKRIFKLIKDGGIFIDVNEHKYLINFLIKLIKIYEDQKKYDERLRKFSSVCNGYLVNKEIIYDESKVSVCIQDKENKKEIELKNLSSGEKQIISLFAKVFLKYESNLIILFDEPELSLSIEWQKKLLPDIMNSKKCKQLLVFTHSPFIFDNEFDKFAEVLTIKNS